MLCLILLSYSVSAIIYDYDTFTRIDNSDVGVFKITADNVIIDCDGYTIENTKIYGTGILTQVSSCKEGHCVLKSFDFAENMPNKRCEAEQTPLLFKSTLKDLIAIRGG